MADKFFHEFPTTTTLKDTSILLLDQDNQTTAVTLDQLKSFFIPTGSVLMFAASGVPTGWLECNGSVLPINNYTNLYNVIGQNYKTISTLNTLSSFQIPDLRGEFVRGWDNKRGVDNGRTFGSWQKGTIFGHDNTPSTYAVVGVVYNGGDVSQNITLTAVGLDNYNILDYPNIQLGSATSTTNTTSLPQYSGNAGSSGTTRPRNVALVYCIKT
jgi:microcystin-dependent protein